MQASTDQLAHPALVNDGHFTAMQVRDGRVRGLAYHLVRLCSAHAEIYGTVLDVEYLRAIIQHAVEHYPDASLRVNLYEVRSAQPQVMTAIRPPVEADERTQSLLPVAYSRPFAHIKHVGSFAQIRYGIQANKVGYDDAVLVTSDGRICESTVANIGFLDRDTVVWPEAPALHGITWQLLDQVLGQRGIEVRRRPVSLESAAGFAGAFLANSIGVVPVSRIGEHDYQPDNATFTRIRGTYHEVAWDEI
jgi:branched-subunit amino acid aminotransferase/4-amino-4-deoxychorismate lyase